MALGIGPGDEVVVPEIDVDRHAPPRSTTSAPRRSSPTSSRTRGARRSNRSAAVLTPRTKAIILVDLYGGFPDLVAFEALAAEHDIALIEDAAEAAGGWHAGRAAGSFGRVSTFSFHGSKTLTTGEGGMVLCDDRALHERMLFLRDHGRLPGDVSFRSVEVALEVQDERAAGRARARAARPHRRADRRGSARSSVGTRTDSTAWRSSSTSSGPASERRTGW